MATKIKKNQINIDTIYPVGSIYITTVSTNPSTYFGGTWVAFGAGKTLVGLDSGDTDFNTVEKTGGAKTHTLTVEQMPSHRHDKIQGLSASQTLYTGESVDGVTNQIGVRNNTGSNNSSWKEALYTNLTGGGQAHNNLQPYITTYMFKRTA